jgi:hypothetical protein
VLQDDPSVRASDRARDRTASALSRAAGEGRLSIETLSLRLDGAFSARDIELLDVLVADLPWWRRPPGALLRNLWRWLMEADAMAPEFPEPLVLPDDADCVFVGRASTCEVRLSDRSVSRRHAQLRRQGDGWRVVDLLSTNGTYLNGRPISSAVARPGDEVCFGGHALRLPRLER